MLEPYSDNGPALLSCVPIQHVLPPMLTLRGPTAGKTIVDLSAAMPLAWNTHASFGLMRTAGGFVGPAVCAPALQGS